MNKSTQNPAPETEINQSDNDLSQLYNYPSIRKLFSKPDSKELQDVRSKLKSTQEKLDTIVRRGSVEESNKASKALKAIGLTLQFLQSLENEQKKSL